MGELIPNGAKNGNATPKSTQQNGDIMVFDDINAFSMAVEALGVTLDIKSIRDLSTDFIGAEDNYLLLNFKEYGTDEPDNLLFLTDTKAYVYSKGHPQPQAAMAFEDVLSEPYGKSTVLCSLTISKVLDNHKLRLDTMIQKIRVLEDNFDLHEYRNMALEFDRLSDRLEEFHDVLIRLQERYYKQIETKYISFDYSVLLAESLSLQR